MSVGVPAVEACRRRRYECQTVKQGERERGCWWCVRRVNVWSSDRSCRRSVSAVYGGAAGVQAQVATKRGQHGRKQRAAERRNDQEPANGLAGSVMRRAAAADDRERAVLACVCASAVGVESLLGAKLAEGTSGHFRADGTVSSWGEGRPTIGRSAGPGSLMSGSHPQQD